MRLFVHLLVASSLGLVFFVGCDDDVGNDGTLVGGPCRSNSDCEEYCETGGDFPEGMCTVECRDSQDCPSDTWCIDKKGGICALYCEANDWCRRGYDCKTEKLKGDRGEEFVCID